MKPIENIDFSRLCKDISIFWLLFVIVNAFGLVSIVFLDSSQEVHLGVQSYESQSSFVDVLRPESFLDIPGVQSVTPASRPEESDSSDACDGSAYYLKLITRGSVLGNSQRFDQMIERAQQHGSYICALSFITPVTTHDSVGLALLFGSLPMLGVLGLLWALSSKSHRLRDIFFDWQPRLDGVKAISSGIVLGLMLFVCITVFLSLTMGDYAQDTFETFRGANVLLILIVLGISAPFIEEYLFRALLLQRLCKSLNQYAALIVTSIIFAAAHFPADWASALALLMIGIVIGLLWLRTKSLLACVVAHSTYNVAAVSFVLLG